MTLAFVFAGLDRTSRDDSPKNVARSSRAEPGDAARDSTSLAEQIRSGDHAAFTAMFLANYDALCRFAESFTRNTADAEEIVEGILARVWEHHRDFTPPAGIGAYLYAAVRNRALNVVRDAKTRTRWSSNWAMAHARDAQAIHDSVDTPGTPSSPTSALAALEREELGVVLRRVIDTLPEHRRTVVTMRWFGGLSHAEIAAALGTTVNAVEIQLRRALKDLAAGVPGYLRE